MNKQAESVQIQIDEAIRNTQTQTLKAIRNISTEANRQVHDIQGRITDAVRFTHDETYEVLQQMHKEVGETAPGAGDFIGNFGALRVSYIRTGRTTIWATSSR